MPHFRGRSPIPTRKAVAEGRAPPIPRQQRSLDTNSNRSGYDVSGPLVDLGEACRLGFSQVASRATRIVIQPGGCSFAGFSESNTRSQTVPLLTKDIDYGQLDDGNWTKVTKKTSRTHSERTVSNSSRTGAFDSSVETSTVAIATHDMSPENLLKLSRRYERLDAAGFRARVESRRTSVESVDSEHGKNDDVMQCRLRLLRSLLRRRPRTAHFKVTGDKSIPEMEAGSSRHKGKENFSEAELNAQHEAFENFSRINRQIKTEPKSTPVGFFDGDFEVQPESSGFDRERSLPTVVVSTRPPKTGEENSGLNLMDEISRAKKHLKELKQRQKLSKVEKHTRKAEDAVRDSIVRQMHTEPPRPGISGAKKHSNKSTARRLPPGSFFEQVIRDTQRVGQPPPPPEDSPSSSSSSEGNSSGDDESEAVDAKSARSVNDTRRKKSKMIIKPIAPNK
ncbi:hypothetical protein B0H13DRAFT_1859670 [Mycena leptocephala]|nr:hypothetical protein B0H13DRAFT_1859670 [Mycena leptocephala]